jgi:hypothetical protein
LTFAGDFSTLAAVLCVRRERVVELNRSDHALFKLYVFFQTKLLANLRLGLGDRRRSIPFYSPRTIIDP